MTLSAILTTIIIGAIAGWLAGQFMKGRGFGLLGNIVIGIIGSFIGGWLFGVLGWVMGGILGAIISAVVGAVLFLFILGLFRR